MRYVIGGAAAGLRMLYLGVLPLIFGRDLVKVGSRCGAVVLSWLVWGGWDGRLGVGGSGWVRWCGGVMWCAVG